QLLPTLLLCRGLLPCSLALHSGLLFPSRARERRELLRALASQGRLPLLARPRDLLEPPAALELLALASQSGLLPLAFASQGGLLFRGLDTPRRLARLGF